MNDSWPASSSCRAKIGRAAHDSRNACGSWTNDVNNTLRTHAGPDPRPVGRRRICRQAGDGRPASALALPLRRRRRRRPLLRRTLRVDPFSPHPAMPGTASGAAPHGRTGAHDDPPPTRPVAEWHLQLHVARVVADRFWLPSAVASRDTFSRNNTAFSRQRPVPRKGPPFRAAGTACSSCCVGGRAAPRSSSGEPLARFSPRFRLRQGAHCGVGDARVSHRHDGAGDCRGGRRRSRRVPPRAPTAALGVVHGAIGVGVGSAGGDGAIGYTEAAWNRRVNVKTVRARSARSAPISVDVSGSGAASSKDFRGLVAGRDLYTIRLVPDGTDADPSQCIVASVDAVEWGVSRTAIRGY